MGRHRTPMEGRRFGRLVVLYQEEKTTGGRYRYACRCDCGNLAASIDGGHLRSGGIRSCGCLQRENLVQTHIKEGHPYCGEHGQSKTRLYKIWSGMKRRCYDRNHKEYHRYGGRGIGVCATWSGNFMEFYRWAVSHGYGPDLCIDRIDNEKGYSPDNCQWLTRSENSKKSARDRASLHTPV